MHITSQQRVATEHWDANGIRHFENLTISRISSLYFTAFLEWHYCTIMRMFKYKKADCIEVFSHSNVS